MEIAQPDDFHRRFLAPLVVAMTTLALGEAILEVATRGALRPPEAITDIYLTLMSGYMAGIEVQKWTQQLPADPSDDPWLERINRAGGILLLWWGLFIGVHLWRYHDPGVPMPASLKPIVMGMTLLVIGKRVSRKVRHSRRGPSSAASEDFEETNGSKESDPPDRQRVEAALQRTADGQTLLELEKQLSSVSRSTIKRALRDLQEEGRIAREGRPRSRDSRYKLV